MQVDSTRRTKPGRVPIPLALRLWAKVDYGGDACWPFTGFRDRDGYGRIGREDRRGWISTHRAAWISVHGPIPDGLVVMHRCDFPSCCRPSHLRLGTMRDNSRDMMAKGRGPRRRKWLNQQIVLAIKQRRAQGDTLVALASLFGISVSHAGYIARGRYWSHVTLESAQHLVPSGDDSGPRVLSG